MANTGSQSLHPFLRVTWKAKKLYEKICMQSAKPYGLTRNEVDVLLFLANNKGFNTAIDIAHYRHISKSLVSKSVESLVSRGYLKSEVDETDRRCNRLFLMPQAEEALVPLQEAQNTFFRILSDTLTPEERTLLLGAFQKISDKMDKYI